MIRTQADITTISAKEQRLLECIRSGQFDSVNVILKHGSIHTLEKTDSFDGLPQLREKSKDHPYQRIETYVHDGTFIRTKRTIIERICD